MYRSFDRWLCGLAIVVCLGLTGCGAASPMSMENYNKLKNGMTMEEVSAVFGFPTPVQPEDLKLGKSYVQQNEKGVDRKTEWEGEEFAYDYFTSKELGGVNTKQIILRYHLGKLESIEHINLDAK